MEECAAFPNGAHDDQVDAWTQGANYLLRRIVEPNIRFPDVFGHRACEPGGLSLPNKPLLTGNLTQAFTTNESRNPVFCGTRLS